MSKGKSVTGSWGIHQRRRLQKDFPDPSMVKKSFAKDADINNVVRKYISQNVPFPTDPKLVFGDFSKTSHLSDAFDLVGRAMDAFDELPAKVREKFENDPQRFLHALEKNPKAIQDAYRELKLRPTDPTPASGRESGQEAPPAPDPAPKSASGASK